MIWLAYAPLVSRTVKVVATFAAGVVIVILVGAPWLGWLTQPLAPWWFGQQPGSTGAFPVAAPVVGTVPLVPVIPAVPVPTLAPLESPAIVEAVIDAAKTWLGVPYRWGGCSRAGIDCSCFVQIAWSTVGVRLPRTTTEQIRVAVPIPASDARAGDLVFFDNTCSDCGANPTHVGLVLGAGQMIDAGDPVKIEPIYGGHNARFGRVH